MDFSQITEDLYIGTTPDHRGYDLLRDLGVRLVINMRFWRGPLPRPGEPGLVYLWLRTFDSPLVPIPVWKLIRGVQEALRVMESGGKVFVHCAYGRHRSVAMGAAILIAQGLSPQVAMSLIKGQRPVADPGAFYIRSRILSFARQWGTAES